MPENNPNPLDFQAFRKQYEVPGNEIVPDPQDFYRGLVPKTARDREAAYRLAQAKS
jgi:hypothetical protein